MSFCLALLLLFLRFAFASFGFFGFGIFGFLRFCFGFFFGLFWGLALAFLVFAWFLGFLCTSKNSAFAF